MKRTATGVILATLALYAFGMIYWGANPLPYTAWKRTSDDAAAGRALLEHFPESGTYYLPGLYNTPETHAALHAAGPVAMIHVTSRDGRPSQEPSVMVKGFFLDLAVVLLIAALLRRAAPALPTYWNRVGFAAIAGLAAVVLIDLGDTVWWYLPLAWKLHQAVFNFSAWVVVGLVLAAYIKPTSTAGVAAGA